MPDFPTWRVVRVFTRREAAVVEALGKASLPAYSPHEDVHATRYPRGKHLSGVRVHYRACLLPGYVFVQCDDDELAVVRVTDFVMASFTPSVPGLARNLGAKAVTTVLALMDAERLGAFDRRSRSNQPTFVNGQAVNLAIGHADPIVGLVIRERLTSGRIRVLAKWLGARREIEVALDRVSLPTQVPQRTPVAVPLKYEPIRTFAGPAKASRRGRVT